MHANRGATRQSGRRTFVKKLRSHGVKDVRVRRGAAVVQAFDVALATERLVDEMDRHVLASGTVELTIVRKPDGSAGLRVVVPLIAREDTGPANCRCCHGAAGPCPAAMARRRTTLRRAVPVRQ
jgi:hypothetical protein